MVRLFVAVELPADMRADLVRLRSPLPRANWVSADNLHLSLRFIGEVDDEQAADIDTELSRIDAPAFELSLAGIGEFGSGERVRTLWLGIEPSPPLLALQSKVESAMRRAWLPPEGRRFAPHVTLARLKNPPLERIAPFIAAHAQFRAGPVAVNRFVLYSSILASHGPTYTAERTYKLAGAPPAGAPLAGADFAHFAREWEASE